MTERVKTCLCLLHAIAEQVRVNIIHAKTVKKVSCNLKLGLNPVYVVRKKRYRIVTFFVCISWVFKKMVYNYQEDQ